MALVTGSAGNDSVSPLLKSAGVDFFTTDFADTINMLGGNDTVFAGGGNDLVNGDAGFSNVSLQWNDYLDGGAGNDTLRGYDGNDTYVVDAAGDEIDAEINDSVGGVDTVRSTKANTDLGGDFIDGFALENLVLVGNGAFNGFGNSNNNVITGNGRGNSLNGLDGNDQILGGGGNDLIDGAKGNDILRGQAGNDNILGGNGVDQRIGGAGNDTFTFQQLTPGEIDRIRLGDGATAFQGAGNAAGDRIDVSGIDANQTGGAGGNQSFIFGGAGVRHLVVVNIGGGVSQVRGNTDNDNTFELLINIEDGGVNANQYTAADFLL